MLQLMPGRRQLPRWSLVISVALALALLIAALRGADWGEMLRTMRQGRLEHLALAFAILSVSYFIRGLRWRVLLSAERAVAPTTCFWATAVGYLGNSVLPARAGEAIRTILLARRTGMSMSYILATALTERLTDAITLVVISLLVLQTVADVAPWLKTASASMAILGASSACLLLVLPMFEPGVHRLLGVLPLPERWRGRVIDIVTQFLHGARSLQAPRRALSFLGLTAVIWFLDALMAMEVAYAIDARLNWPGSLFLLAALGLASAAPSTPGYVGIYQFVAVTVLAPFGFTRSAALVYIIAFQLVSYAVVGIWGGIGLWQMQRYRSTMKVSTSTPLPTGTRLER